MTKTIDPMDEAAPDTRGDGPVPTRAGFRRPLLIAIILVVIGGIAAATLFGGKGADTPAAEQKTTPALTVTAAEPRVVDWPETASASGAIAPWQEASIGTQIGSYQLIDVRVNVGDRVRKGQVLARLDPALLRAEEAQLLASFEQAEANRKRALELQGGGAMSDQDVLGLVTQARTAAASLEGKRLQLRYTDVLAPDDGTISARTATLGAVVPPGQELFRLIRQDRLEWRGELTAAQLAQIQAGQEIVLGLPDGSAAAATIRQTAPMLDSQSRLATVYADIRPGSRARAGMYASGRIVLQHSPALIVPAQSIVIRDGRSHVLKLSDDGGFSRVSLQSVTVGRRNGEEAEIVEGLGSGERIAVQGAGFLNEGDVVRVAGTP
ncbi:MAG: efflux RND transporter periplasmic adaptor subunit [Steroidobacteraceae bacterium]